MRVNRRRSDIEIMGDVLRMGKSGAGKTRLMYRVDMSYSQTQKYLWFLTSQGFLIKVETGKSRVIYKVTDKGNNLLKSIENLEEILGFSDEEKYYIAAT